MAPGGTRGITPKPSLDGRVIELDSLRALAALGVVLFHTNSSWLPFGWAAVDLFFVLSGFLITSIILRHGDSPRFLRNFYLRRGLRTWPIYYLLIVSLCIVSPLLARPCLWARLPFTLTYTQGLSRIWPTAAEPFSRYLAHTWSLAIEEQFYLIWPALVLFVGRRWLVPMALAGVCLSVYARSQGVWWDLCSRCDGLILGAILAAIQAVGRAWSRRASIAIRLSAVCALFYLVATALRAGIHPDQLLPAHPALSVLAFNLLWLGVIKLVLDRSGQGSTGVLRLPWLVRLGQISYGLYLYHFPVLAILLDIARGLGFMGKLYPLKILSIALSIVLARLSWRLVEGPILSLKDRFAYSAQATHSAALASRTRAAVPALRASASSKDQGASCGWPASGPQGSDVFLDEFDRFVAHDACASARGAKLLAVRLVEADRGGTADGAPQLAATTADVSIPVVLVVPDLMASPAPATDPFVIGAANAPALEANATAPDVFLHANDLDHDAHSRHQVRTGPAMWFVQHKTRPS